MVWPKISVITPSYNQAEFLEATLQSVVRQQYPNVEHIVIDGGSTDGSVEVIRRYEDKLAYWISERDQGQTDALVKGFNKATGDILCWLNSDDLFEPWTLHEVTCFFEDNPTARAVYGDSTWIDLKGKVIRPKKEHHFNRFIWLYDHDYLPQPSTFWRAELYEKVGGLDRTFDLAMDSDLWIRFADVVDFYHVRRPWSKMRFYPEQKTQRLHLESNKEALTIRNRYLGREPMYSRHAKRVVAKCSRITLKLLSGSYW